MDDTDLLAMGGYAAYVWPAYLAAATVLMALAAASLLRWRRVARDLARLEAGAGGRRGALR